MSSIDAMDRIKKLLAHEKSARSIGSLKEAEAFAEKVQEMLLTHKLSLSDVERDAEEHNEPISEEAVHSQDTDHFYKAKSQVKMSPLAHVIAEAFMCRVLLGGKSIYFVGRESNRRVAVDLYKLLVNISVASYKDEEAAYRHSVEFKMSPASRTAKVIAFKNGYFIGFTRKIKERLSDKLRKLTTTSTALLVVSKALVEVDNHLIKMSLRVRTSRGINFSTPGLAAGERRASGISLTSKGLL